jgi:hypothetical protein
MGKIIFPDREEYSLEKIELEGRSTFFYVFQQSFIDYVRERLETGRKLLSISMFNEDSRATLSRLLKDEHCVQFPNFNQYVGNLERAFNAASLLEKEYDLGIGIAKKGTWLSFVHGLNGLDTKEVLVSRYKDDRFMFPLSVIRSEDVEDKRIVIFDNDLVSGNSVKVVGEKMLSRNARSVDLLLVYGVTRLQPEFYEQIKGKFRNKPKILGKSESGEIVIDTRCETPDCINRTYSLDNDFSIGPERLNEIICRLMQNG